MQDMNEKSKVRGYVEIVTRCNKTGEILDKYEDNNVILNQGLTEITRAMTVLDTNIHRIKTIKIGNDVGNGTVLNPQMATVNLTESDQTVLYEVPESAFFVSYIDFKSVRFSASLNGIDVMQQFPTLPNLVYTSAVLYTFGNKGVAFKRFPARTISSLISVDISWTLTYEQ